MKCREVLARYSEFLDGELKGPKREEVTRHLERCEDCHTYQQILSEGLTSYRRLPRINLSDDFYLRLQHRLFHLKERDRSVKRGRVLLRGIVPTFCASAVFFLAVFVMSSRTNVSDGQVEIAGLQQGLQSESGSREMKGRAGSVGEKVQRREVAVRGGGRRNWTEKFVRNNMWRIFMERPSNLLVDGQVSVGSGVVPVNVSGSSPGVIGALTPVRGEPYAGLGVSVTPVEFEVRKGEVREEKRGLRVLEVRKMTPAHVAGILPGDTIVALDHIPVEGPEGLSQLVRAFTSQTKSVQIYRLGRLIELYVDL
jgi:hypothetical protein